LSLSPQTDAALTPGQIAKLQRLRSDLPFFAEHCLSIRTKSGSIEPFILNRAQTYIHERLEEQKARTGKVRALILKGRQQGCSTYVAGRFYHQTTMNKGLRTFILTHEDAATQNLFEMVARFHKHSPPCVTPSTSAENAKELFFDRLDSGYKVGTAGTKAVGRSSTLQRFHGSEAAFWPHAESHAAGILQALSETPGSEGILESTANGVGNLFHQKWRDAERGIGEFIAIFVPWYWQDEYRKPVPPRFALSPEEDEYKRLGHKPSNPEDYQLVAAWHEGSEAPMQEAFAAWQEAAAHLNAVGGTTDDSTEEHERQWREAARANFEARRAVRMEPAYSLRALQMRAIAFLSDMHQEEPLLAHASRFADDWKAAMERDSAAAHPAHAFAAYSFARDLIRLAAADPSGPRHPGGAPLV
jgi:hypothetical protein